MDTDEVLTAAEIEERFPDEWVLVGDLQTDENLEVTAGKVLWHSKDRDAVDRKAIELHPKRFTVFYTGRLPDENTAIAINLNLGL